MSQKKMGAPGIDFETWETTNPTPHPSEEAVQ
jgi:hypothetical protein